MAYRDDPADFDPVGRNGWRAAAACLVCFVCLAAAAVLALWATVPQGP
jgi:hypothetical protein